MKRLVYYLLITAMVLLMIVVLVLGTGVWHVGSKLPQRQGIATLSGLKGPVTVAFDERGVPHIEARNEADLYRALGYVHAQDRLFQMEILRRLARGELAEILGPKLLDTDKLFRTLGLRAHADQAVKKLDPQQPATRALLAYLDGINQFQATHSRPVEFELLGIQPRPFTPQDTLAVSGYLAYSFAAAFRTEPMLTYVRDQLGADYLRVFDLDLKPQGVLSVASSQTSAQAKVQLSNADWHSLARLGELSLDALTLAGVPQYEGSNAWAVSGARTRSGKPLLAGDPHISFSAPAVWYEAHLKSPGFELYGHYQALNPVALLGHNQAFGWSLTMFQNDDVDLVAEKVNSANPKEVWYHGQWVELQTREEIIAVKGAPSVTLNVQRSPHGPIINQAFTDSLPTTPVAMWWAFLETENPVLDAFYELNRATTREQARQAVSKIHAPGLNVVWANAGGDIGWWAAARLPKRPAGVNPNFILDGSSAQSDKPGFYDFSNNPQEENPARGYIVSANHQPAARNGVSVPGYYNLPDRAQRLNALLQADVTWDVHNSQALQLDDRTDYGPRLLKPLLPLLQTSAANDTERELVTQLAQWDGRHHIDSVAATVFNQFIYELARLAMADELGAALFKNLLRTRALDQALPRLAADADSPWWDQRETAQRETRADIVKQAWQSTLAHLTQLRGATGAAWRWGQLHTLTHGHPLGQQKPLDRLFNVGPFAAPGGRELPNNISLPVGPAPWAASYGPSTRRLIDFSEPGKALGINPVGQSGVLLDAHYEDQARTYIQGGYQPMHLETRDVAQHVRSTLTLQAQP